MEVLSNLALAFASPRIFSSEREIGEATERSGAIVRKKKVEIIDPKAINKHFGRFKRQIFVTCRSYGSKIDALGMWAIPVEGGRAEGLEAALSRIAVEWDREKAEFVGLYPDMVKAQIQANPEDAYIIQRLAPSVADIDSTIRLSWGVMKINSGNLVAHQGLDREIDGLPAQAAHEIAMELKERVSAAIGGGKYTRASLTALQDVARKAESFGFLSPALAAVRPAVDRLVASLPAGVAVFDGVDALVIGAMIGFLSDSTRLISEGRRIEESVFSPPATSVIEVEAVSVIEVAPVSVIEVAPVSVIEAPVSVIEAPVSVIHPEAFQAPTQEPEKPAAWW